MALGGILRTLATLLFALLAACLQLPREPEGDPCTCLRWEGVYRDLGVRCGSVFEGGGVEMCTTFFEAIPSNFCFNVQQGPDHGQWCYVRAACERLGGGGVLGSAPGVSWKMCDAGHDDMSREMTVEFLLGWAAQNDIMPALLMKEAYPTWEGRSWEQVRGYFAAGDNHTIDLAAFPEDLRGEVSSAMINGTPAVFDSEDHHPPFGILEGAKIFEVITDEEYVRSAGSDVWTHPYRLNSVELMNGGP